MVMFRTKFRPQSDKPRASAHGQQQQQPQPTVPPIEDERGPQAPVREPAPKGPPERAR